MISKYLINPHNILVDRGEHYNSGSENACHSKNDILSLNLMCFYGSNLKLSKISKETSK